MATNCEDLDRLVEKMDWLKESFEAQRETIYSKLVRAFKTGKPGRSDFMEEIREKKCSIATRGDKLNVAWGALKKLRASEDRLDELMRRTMSSAYQATSYEPLLTCRWCAKKFGSRAAKREHEKVCSRCPTLECVHCGKEIRAGLMKKHYNVCK